MGNKVSISSVKADLTDTMFDFCLYFCDSHFTRTCIVRSIHGMSLYLYILHLHDLHAYPSEGKHVEE